MNVVQAISYCATGAFTLGIFVLLSEVLRSRKPRVVDTCHMTIRMCMHAHDGSPVHSVTCQLEKGHSGPHAQLIDGFNVWWEKREK